MKKCIFYISALLLFLSCSGAGKKAETEPAVNPLWGMWVQQEPATDAKREILFTEDNKGFVFVADSFHCTTHWRQDSLLYILFVQKSDTARPAVSKRYGFAIDADTLYLNERSDSASVESRYIRFRQ